jgi:murein endopeptidase
MQIAAQIALGLTVAASGLQVHWHHSIAVGTHTAGRLEHGVRLPAQGRSFFTWDPVLRRSPNRAWRRWGTDQLVRVVLDVARAHHAAHPRAPRMAVGDLSRPRGGDFGPQFGYIGHASHQNGLDVDVYYPRADGREEAPRDAGEIDRQLSQELVDRFLAAGAQVIFVGPNTGLRGPPERVQPLVHHDNHLHVRLEQE